MAVVLLAYEADPLQAVLGVCVCVCVCVFYHAFQGPGNAVFHKYLLNKVLVLYGILTPFVSRPELIFDNTGHR